MTGFVRYSVKAEGTIADLRAATRLTRQYAQKGLRQGVKEVAVPRARALAPRQTGRYAASMKGGVTGLTGFIVSNDPRAGLLNFGGTRRDIIRPRTKRAVLTPHGPRALVKGPRHYKGSHSMEKAAEASVAEIADITEASVLEAFGRYFPIR